MIWFAYFGVAWVVALGLLLIRYYFVELIISILSSSLVVFLLWSLTKVFL